jgi:pilus assembly protein Flp/PilA
MPPGARFLGHGGIDVAGFFSRFLTDEIGATAIEYALIASGIALVLVATIVLVGEAVTGKFEQVETAFP